MRVIGDTRSSHWWNWIPMSGHPIKFQKAFFFSCCLKIKSISTHYFPFWHETHLLKMRIYSSNSQRTIWQNVHQRGLKVFESNFYRLHELIFASKSIAWIELLKREFPLDFIRSFALASSYFRSHLLNHSVSWAIKLRHKDALNILSRW